MDIYLDNAATTFPKPPCVVKAVTDCMENYAVNAGRGVYPLGHKADEVIFETRKKVASLLTYPKGQVIFSYSATFAINQVLLGINWKANDVIYTTPFEHNSVARVLYHLENVFGVKVIIIPVNSKTFEYDIDALRQKFMQIPPTAVVMTHVSNVFGLITPVISIAEMAKAYSSIIVVDGAQGGPLLPLEDTRGLIDFYIFSGHKTFYGPFGIAGFVITGNVPLKPIIFGGTGSHSELMSMPTDLPFGQESGSPNIVAIAGLNAACDWLCETGTNYIREHEKSLLRYVVEGLADFSDDVRLYVHNDLNNHLGTLSFTIDGYKAQEIGMILSQEYHISTRTGLHCAPQAHKFLGTVPHGTIRVGFGFFNNKDDCNQLIDAIKSIVD